MDPRILEALQSTWGYTSLRPLQAEAVQAALDGRDALVVLPTGGGKSLCYQLPPLLRPGLGLVVSPLIALMKDQVDALRLAGYPAVALHSGNSPEDVAEARRALGSGRAKLLYVSPERLLLDGFVDWLSGRVTNIAVDEAHCISQWGHDFRPEYRRLAEIRARLPGVPIQAFTATATPRVREDITAQLAMRDPAVLVGTFDRPNLTYRVLPRVGDGLAQVRQVIQRHEGEGVIVYCISRRQTEDIAEALSAAGIAAEAYHAGLAPEVRGAVQERFLGEELDVVVATVAFGMGIDRGDVRAVIHASMPKSVEAYQQETGRAGRDGLPAECVLLYASSDVVRWGQLITRSSEEGGADEEVLRAQRGLLQDLARLVSGAACRHRALSAYFGQSLALPPDGCGACDVCLGELEEVPDSTTVARKVLSCVARLRGDRDAAYGAAYVADVLRGSTMAKIGERGHDRLSTFGLLRDVSKDELVGYVNQLVDRGLLWREEGDYPVVRLTQAAAPVLKGTEAVALVRARIPEVATERRRRRVDVTGVEAAPLDATETKLFAVLKRVRRELAHELGVPPFIVFGDAPLMEMARRKPTTLEAFLGVKGVGQVKVGQFGATFVAAIKTWCEENRVDPSAGRARPVGVTAAPAPGPKAPPSPSDARKEAFALYAQGASIDLVAASTGRARSTAAQMLVEYLRASPRLSIRAWVDAATERRVLEALQGDRLKPAFDALGGEVPYDTIRIVAAWRDGGG